MCEVFNRLNRIGIVKGVSCPFEPSCDRRIIPTDDFNPLIHCTIASTAKMLESNLDEPDAQDVIAEYKSKLILK